MDSPGHVDFSGEVEAALRVCDGAIVVVDVVEGVCVQTVTVLRAALEQAVRPVLVLNKIDRLFSELNLTPIEAYRRIQMVIEQVNVVMGVREVEQMMEAATLHTERTDGVSGWTLDDSAGALGNAESGYFSPELGNVAFASAIDNWAFRISDFAKIFAERFGISERVLRKTLWGEYYLQLKAKRIVRRKASDTSTKSEPMFSRFVLASIHSVYNTVLSTQNDLELAVQKRKHISERLGLKLNNRDLKHRDTGVVLRAIMGTWLPAARTLLAMVRDKLPTALDAQSDPERLHVLWPHTEEDHAVPTVHQPVLATIEEKRRARRDAFMLQHSALKRAQSDLNAPVLAVVTKMIERPRVGSSTFDIRQPKSKTDSPNPKGSDTHYSNVAQKDSTEPQGQGKQDTQLTVEMMAFARLLSGTISVGMKLYVYAPKYNIAADGAFDRSAVAEATVTGLHLLMGRGTEELRSVTAGAIVGIAGVDEVVLKTATLSTEPPGLCLPAALLSSSAGLQRDAVVRVAVEPHLPSDIPKLQSGLRKLNQSDPSVETLVTSTGEHIVAASGELHLERCLKDLREHFAKGIAIHVSNPMVAFRETSSGGVSTFVEPDSRQDDSGMDDDGRLQEATCYDINFFSDALRVGRRVMVSTSSFSFRVVAAPIPKNVATVLENSGKQLRSFAQFQDVDNDTCDRIRSDLRAALARDSADVGAGKVPRAEFEDLWLDQIFPRVWSSGPRRFGANLLVGPYARESLAPLMRRIFSPAAPDSQSRGTPHRRLKDLENAVTTGFQMGVQAGPLADEPMHGVAIFIESIRVVTEKYGTCQPNEGIGDECSDEDSEAASAPSGSLSGLAIGSMKEATRKALLQANARLMEAVLHVDISVTNDALGSTYTVIGKRRGRVLDEQMRDGVNIFRIEALIPVVESFGFADILRKQTSGFAVPQMVFSHWETIDIDPFWEPRTEEELEDLGAADSTAENNNLSRKLMNNIRRRKGLRVEEKIVEKAEKQRTLSRKK